MSRTWQPEPTTLRTFLARPLITWAAIIDAALDVEFSGDEEEEGNTTLLLVSIVMAACAFLLMLRIVVWLAVGGPT